MKKIIFYFLAITFSAIPSACNKVLEEHPQGIISPSNFYNTDGDFNSAINGSLLSLWGFFNNALPYIILAGAEDLSSKSDAPQAKIYDVFNANATDSYTRSTWTSFYNCINVCNPIIANVSDAKEVSSDNKKFFEGEARYLRALSYFWLTRLYGEVPLILNADDQSNAANVAQSGIAEVYNVIIQDLSFAEANLPLTFAEKGKPTKGAATSLLASVYLTMAGWPLNDASKYAMARDEAKKVIDMGIYALEPNFEDLWTVSKQINSKEMIFLFFGNSSTGPTASHRHMSTRPGEEGGYQSYFSEARFFNQFPDGPRKEASFHTVFTDAAHTTWQNSRIGQPFIEKYRDGGDAATKEGPVIIVGVGSGTWVENRYAEVLLIYAEAANEAEGGPSLEAVDAINQVRRRAGGYNQSVYPDLQPGLSQQEFRTAVINERSWELAFEGKRWFDLVRKEMVVEVNKALYPKVDEHNMLLPKPQTELDLVKGLQQNPGY